MPVDLFQHGGGGGQQMQPPDAPVLPIRPALDQAERHQPVYQPGHRNRLYFQQIGGFLLAEAGMAGEP